MTTRTRMIGLAVLTMLTLSACSTDTGADATTSGAGGAIELAVAESCTEANEPACVAVQGEHVVLPSDFERASVENAAVVEGHGPNAVDLTFTKDGATVLKMLTENAARAGNSARLVIKIGGEIQSVVAVMEAVDNGRVQLELPPDEDAEKVVDLLQGG